MSINDNLFGIGQNSHGQRYHGRFVDIHCHCLPGVDDGPTTKAEAFALCQALVDDCITTVIATPHQLGRFSDCNEAAQIREDVIKFNDELKTRNIPLTILPGADVRVDERICELIKTDRILTLADGGKFLLLELPHEIFIDITPLLAQLSAMGINAIISHPERHPILTKQITILHKWLEQSAHMQVTAGSLLGQFGPNAQRTAWNLLQLGWVSFVATDSHNVQSRGPCMKTAFERISSEIGENIAYLVCVENPLRVIKGQDVIPVENIEKSFSMNTRDGSDERVRSHS